MPTSSGAHEVAREPNRGDLAALPFIDEHALRVTAPADAVWAALLRVLGGTMTGSATFARLLGCDPVKGTVEFAGRPGDAVPGFRVVESEPGRRLALRGRHRFAIYALTLVFEDSTLRAETRAVFPGVGGRIYRALVIGSGGHRVITRYLLRRVARTTRQGK